MDIKAVQVPTSSDKRITIYVMNKEHLESLDEAYEAFCLARGAFKVSKSQFYSHLLLLGLDTMKGGINE